MALESISKTERIMNPDETSEAISRMKSIPEKAKLLEDLMRAIDEEGKNNNNQEKHELLGKLYSQYEAMKKTLVETLGTPETIPTFTGDADMDQVLRARLVPEISANTGEIKPEENIELVPAENPEILKTFPVAFAQENVPAQTAEAPEIKMMSAPESTEPNSGSPVSPIEDPKNIQAKNIAEKIKNNIPLSNEELAFRKNPETYPLLEKEMMENVNSNSETGTTIEMNEPASIETSKDTANFAERLQRSREDYVIAFLNDRKNPNAQDGKERLSALKAEYDKNTKNEIDEIWEQTKNRKTMADSLQDEWRALEKEILSRDSAETRERVAKSISKGAKATGNALLYSLLLTGKLINDGIDGAKKVIGKITSGQGKGAEWIKKKLAEAKANSGKSDGEFIDGVLSPLHKMFGGETGKRWFEQGTKEQQAETKKKLEEENKKKAEDKKIADTAKKTDSGEKKKIENGDKKKTPEELEKSQMKNFLKTSFESGHTGNQMTEQETKEASEAWKKLKDKSVHAFMHPENVDWGKKKNAEGKDEEIKKTVADYSKAEQGLHKKLKDAYDDAQYKQPMGNGMTLEQFIKNSLKNGTLK